MSFTISSRGTSVSLGLVGTITGPNGELGKAPADIRPTLVDRAAAVFIQKDAVVITVPADHEKLAAGVVRFHNPSLNEPLGDGFVGGVYFIDSNEPHVVQILGIDPQRQSAAASLAVATKLGPELHPGSRT